MPGSGVGGKVGETVVGAMLVGIEVGGVVTGEEVGTIVGNGGVGDTVGSVVGVAVSLEGIFWLLAKFNNDRNNVNEKSKR